MERRLARAETRKAAGYASRRRGLKFWGKKKRKEEKKQTFNPDKNIRSAMRHWLPRESTRSTVYVIDNTRMAADVINTGYLVSRTRTVSLELSLPIRFVRYGPAYKRWPIFRVYCVPSCRALFSVFTLPLNRLAAMTRTRSRVVGIN